jgi:hypothetical protein
VQAKIGPIISVRVLGRVTEKLTLGSFTVLGLRNLRLSRRGLVFIIPFSSMAKLILWVAAIITIAYWKRHGFTRAWYILRTGAGNPDWEKVGGDYLIADWEKGRRTKSAANEEAKAPNVSE